MNVDLAPRAASRAVRHRARWICLMTLLSTSAGDAARAAPPPRLVLIDFESDGDAARLR